jgi:hypothetical protein
MHVLGDDMGGWEELVAKLIGELGIRSFPELSHYKFFCFFIEKKKKTRFGRVKR